METSFFTGSENLHKYLVSVGMMLTILTVYFPLREKQDLEILTNKLNSDIKKLNFKIKENFNNVKTLQLSINNNGSTIENKKLIIELNNINIENNLNQIEIDKNNAEIKLRSKYICIYNIMFLVLFPIGIILIGFGFYKWYNTKLIDDEIQNLECRKLKAEVDKLTKEN